jgi:hypothetical protein
MLRCSRRLSKKLGEGVTLLTCILEVSGSNPSQDNTSNYSMIASFHILPSSFAYNHLIRIYVLVVLATDRCVK